MPMAIHNELRFNPEQTGCCRPYFTKPTEVARWALCDLGSQSSVSAIRLPVRCELFLVEGFTHTYPELSGDVHWSPSVSFVPSTLNSWMSSWNSWTVVGVASAAAGSALFASAASVPALQVVGIALMSLAVLVVCGFAVLKTGLVAARMLKLGRNIQWLQKQSSAQTAFLRYHQNNYAHQPEVRGDCEGAIKTISSLFAVSASRKTLSGCKVYRELLIQALAEHVISLLFVTSIVLLCVFGGVFGLTALPTLVMGGVVMMCVIGCMVASVKTILSVVGDKGHKCKQLIQQSWEQAVISEEFMREPETVLTDHLSVLSDSAQHPAFLSLCMRLFKGGALLTSDEITIFKSALQDIEHLLIDARSDFKETGLDSWNDDIVASFIRPSDQSEEVGAIRARNW